MRSTLGLGSVILSGLATAGLALLVLPGGGEGDTANPPETVGAAGVPETTARMFWNHAIAGRCRQASRLMWWPADIDARRQQYVAFCAEGSTVRVDVGEARATSSIDVPYGATDYVVIPVTVQLRGQQPTQVDLAMVQVDRRWYVTR